MMNRYKFQLLLLIPLAIYFAFGVFHLSKFETADEHFWIDNDRIHRYWNSIAEKKWKGTRVSDKPGITLAYVSGIGMLFENKNGISEGEGLFSKHDPNQMEHDNFVFRLPLLIFNGLFAFFFFWILRKLFNGWIALWSASLMLLSPVLLGVSQIVNPDSLSWIFLPATIFSYLAWLKFGENKFAYLSTLFLGLMLATKYIGVILFPFLFLLDLLCFYFQREKSSDKIKYFSIGYFGIVSGAFLIFSMFMPAVFVKSQYLFKDLIGAKGMDNIFWPIMALDLLIILDAHFWESRILKFFLDKFNSLKKYLMIIPAYLILAVSVFVFLNWSLELDIFNINDLPFDLRQADLFSGLPLYQKIILQFRPFIFALTPLTLVFFFWTLYRQRIEEAKYQFEISAIVLFFVSYFAAVTCQNLLVTIRYGIILYPLAIVLAAIGIFDWSEKYPKLKKAHIFSSVVIFSVASLWLAKPFYFNYTNDFLPKSYLITGAWGYGGREAADFLNDLPDAENITVVSDYSGACGFVKGNCVEMSNDVRDDLIKKFAEGTEGWYFVVSRRGQVRWNYVHEFNQFNGQKPLWEMEIDNRPENYIRVYQD